MPGYGSKNEMYAPSATETINSIKSRFALPNLTIVQLVLLVAIIVYAWSVRKADRSIIMVLGLSIGILHIYDHLYRVKRGPEHLFFLPKAKKEGYKCGGCN